MNGRSYYNEIDPYAADWLENLILVGLIAPGDVDRRSIEDVTPDDLRGYTQCHFFAGIGVWSYALRLAGWPDDRPVWTGSCPCQPFSAAGKSRGTADERHLWPAWFWLVEQCRPRVVFGEQVEAAIKHDWLDLVQADLEGIGYSTGAVGIPAAGVGAPHGRARLWFVGDSVGAARERDAGGVPATQAGQHGARLAEHGRGAVELGDAGTSVGELADDDDEGGQRNHSSGELFNGERTTQRHDVDGRGALGSLADGGALGELADDDDARLEGQSGHGDNGGQPGRVNPNAPGSTAAGSRTFWSACDWLPCRDGKARPVESGSFPLAHGAPARVGRLRAYGNAIVPQVAAEVIRAYMECRP